VGGYGQSAFALQAPIQLRDRRTAALVPLRRYQVTSKPRANTSTPRNTNCSLPWIRL